MRTNFSLSLIIIILALSPLSFDPCMYINGARLTCNDLGWAVAAVLSILYFYTNNLLNTFIVLLISIASVAILIPSIFFGAPSPDLFTYLRYVSAILIVPIASKIFSSRQRYIFVLAILGVLSLQAQWSITQFILQHDLGMHALGESRIDSSYSGVAKFSIASEKLIRPYGPHSHPNDLAGSLMIGLILVSIIILSFWPHTHAYLLSLLSIASTIVIAIILSFTRSAYASLFLWSLVFALPAFSRNRFTIPAQTSLRTICIIVIVSFITISPLVYYRFTDPHDSGLSERISGLSMASDIILGENALFGIGIGQYKNAVNSLITAKGIMVNPWEIDNVHSAPLLLIAELGIILSSVIITFLIIYTYMTHSWHILFIISPLLLLDHYFLTQTAPLLLLSIILVLLYYVPRFAPSHHI